MFIFLIFLLITVFLVQQYSQKEELDGLKAHISSDVNIVEPEKNFLLKISLRNEKFRFLPFLKLHLYIPEEFYFPELKKGSLNKTAGAGMELVFTTWLLPRQSLDIEIVAAIKKRGRYLLNGMQISSGDFLGLREMSNRYDDFLEIVCLPKEYPVSDKIESFGGFLGEISVKRFIFEDPSLTLGFREYTGREPMKQISWLRSARSSSLMVKEMDHTEESSVIVVLNIDYKDCNAKERAFSMTRTLCKILEQKRIHYAFCSNALSTGNIKSWKYVSEGLGKAHFSFILEGLGRASYQARCDFKTLLQESFLRGNFGLIFITAGTEQCSFAKMAAQKKGLSIFCLNALEGFDVSTDFS